MRILRIITLTHRSDLLICDCKEHNKKVTWRIDRCSAEIIHVL